jgi:TPR repeat protein
VATESRNADSDGLMREGGLFSPAINLEVALIWFREVAEGGDVYTQRRLRWAYQDGDFSE